MNNLTAYRSPISLLSLREEEAAVFSESILTLAREKLFSHSPLDEDAETVLNSVTATNWPFHKAIYEQEGLLQFLEEGQFEETAMQKASFLRYNPAFVQFVSGYFAIAFHNASAAICREKAPWPSLLKLMDYASFILPHHQPPAFAAISLHLQQHIRTLAPLNWEQFVQDEEQLDFVFSPDWITFINNLPAACTAERNEMIKMLLQLLKRFRLDAAPDYLKAFCSQLHKLTMEEPEKLDLQDYENSFRLPRPMKEAVPPKKKQHWPLYAGGGALLVVLAILLAVKLSGKKHQRPEQPEDKYMEAVETVSAADQRNSSVNERNLKAFFYLSGRQKNRGVPRLLQTGATPLPGVTKLPAGDGNSILTVRNETTADALLFYFGSDNPLVGEDSRIVSVYIRRGEEYRCRFQPDFGRFNFLFGKQWVTMDNPVPFPIQTGNTNSFPLFGQRENMPEMWMIRDFFRNVPAHQPYLTHDLLITNIEQQTVSTGTNLVYTLLNEKDKKKRYDEEGYADIVLREKKGRFSVKATSSMYVYRSFPTFNPEDLR